MQLHEQKKENSTEQNRVTALNILFHVMFIKSRTYQLNHLKSCDNHYNNSIFLALYLWAANL